MLNTVIPLLLFALIITSFSALAYLPSTTPYSPWNTGGNGLSTLYRETHSTPTGNLTRETCSTTIILVLNKPIPPEQASIISNSVKCGSTLIIGDTQGYSTPILRDLGLTIAFHEAQVMDQISSHNNRWQPKTIVMGSYNIVVPNATYIQPTTKPTLLQAWTSPYAYADLDGDGYLSPGDPVGRYTLLAGWRVGRGRLILIPSTLYFTNNYIRLQDNLQLIKTLSHPGRTIIYTPTLNPSMLDRVKLGLAHWMTRSNRDLTWIITLASSTALTYLWASRYIDKGRGSKTKNIIILLLSAAPYLIDSTLTDSLTYGIAPLILLPLLPYTTPYISYATALALSSATLSPAYSAAYIILLLIISTLTKQREGQSILGPSSQNILLLQAVNSLLIFIYLPIITSITTAILLFLLIPAAVYTVTLRKIVVEEVNAPQETYTGIPINIIIAAHSPSPATIYVRDMEATLEYGIQGDARLNIPYKPSHTGLNKVTLRIIATDPLGYSWRTLGTWTVAINVLPQAYKILARAESILSGRGGGELLSKLSMTLLLNMEELNARPIIASEKQLEEIAGYAAGEGGGEGLGGRVHGLIRGIIREYLEGTTGMKARLGDYMGVREYVPGDDPRNIHWKKSLGILRLVSKEYTDTATESTAGAFGMGGEDILLACLDCTGNTELDILVTRTLKRLVDTATIDPDAPYNLILHTYNTTMILQGTVTAVLNLLYNTLRKNPLAVKYKYDSPNTYLTRDEIHYIETGEPNDTLDTLLTSLATESKNIIQALLETGLRPPKQFTVLHCKAASTRASFIVHSLVNAGYTYQGGGW